MNILTDIIPAQYRKALYAVYAAIGVVFGSIALALEPDPSWLIPATAVYAYVGAAFGLTAASNTSATGAHTASE